MAFTHRIGRLATAGRGKQQSLHLFSAFVFFFVLFDGILGYLAPVTIANAGIDMSTMGLIIGSSSIFGFLFDMFLCEVLSDTRYTRLFLLMIVLAASFPVLLFGKTSLALYIAAMAVWGCYYDLYNLGTLDFIARSGDEAVHAANYGFVRIFDSLGYLLAPLLASLLIARAATPRELTLSLWGLLFVSLLAYVALTNLTRRHTKEAGQPQKHGVALLVEAKLWSKIGRILFPVLFLAFIMNVIDAFFWTIGPILSERISASDASLSGAFMVAFGIPPLLVGWFVGRFSRRLGKKRTALIALCLGSLPLLLLPATKDPYAMVTISFFASLFFSIAWPAMNGAFADYLAESERYAKEIVTLEDAFVNLGNVIGPVTGGFLAEWYGERLAFFFIGAIGIAAAVFLWAITPRSITVLACEDGDGPALCEDDGLQ